MITVDENEPITKNATGLLEKEDSEIAVKGEEDDVEEEEADVVAVNGGTLEEKTAAVEQIHVVEVHIECSDPSSDESPQNSDVDPTNGSLTPPVSPVASPQNPDPLDGSLMPPVLAGSTKTPPNTPRRKVCLFLAELKDTAGKNL